LATANRFALVTGTSSGIGEAVVRELLRRRWAVIGIARRSSPIADPGYRHCRFDLADLAGLTAKLEPELAAAIGSEWSRMGLVNNAATADPLGPLERDDPIVLSQTLALNLATPCWLMGLMVRLAARKTPLRMVNVSSGAAVHPFPGLGAYAAAKAGLRMAGMVFAKELESSERPGGPRGNATILSYEPGIVETEMQVTARSRPTADFPWVGMFTGFHRDGILVPPAGPAAEIADYLESDPKETFTERRFGG